MTRDDAPLPDAPVDRRHAEATGSPASAAGAPSVGGYREPLDLLCLSHLRWRFVYQRPQHLMARFARAGWRVLFVEEPAAAAAGAGGAALEVREEEGGIRVLVPRLPEGAGGGAAAQTRRLLSRHLAEAGVGRPVAWFYTPMALDVAGAIPASLTVYDCMDELAAFRGAPPELVDRERELMRRADVVFTGGQGLYEAKRGLHPNVHAFPSGVDVAHFGRARDRAAAGAPEPEDQAGIARPRLGFFGVLDERFDGPLVAAVAEARPEWQVVLLGPVVKVDPAALPRAPNIHYLGPKAYADLPAYMAGWDVALLPFALNESTRFISPTKTPEYLAGGLPVVSTPVRDVERGYGRGGLDLVEVAGEPAAFVAAIERSMARRGDAAWLARVDRALAGMSWDGTWEKMKDIMACAKPPTAPSP